MKNSSPSDNMDQTFDWLIKPLRDEIKELRKTLEFLSKGGICPECGQNPYTDTVAKEALEEK